MTKYLVRLRFHHTDHERTLQFDTATERALAVIGYGAFCDVLEQSVIDVPDENPDPREGADQGNNLLDACAVVSQDEHSCRTRPSGRLWSLWDIMNHCDVAGIAQAIGQIALYEVTFAGAASRNEIVASENIRLFLAQLAFAAKVLKEGGMGSASQLMVTTYNHIVSTRTMHPEALNVEARHAREKIEEELSRRRFLRVANTRREYLDRDDLFGSAVTAAFPSAKEDVKESGNCLAAECTTAAVFHLMRAAEFGLRALANDRRIRIPKNKPLELANWEEIIKELEKAETEIQSFHKTLAREAQYDFYHGVMMQFRAFKNVFRNQVMHVRKTYDRDRALSVHNQVKEFMQTLASRISEKTRTPKQWKGTKWITP